LATLVCMTTDNCLTASPRSIAHPGAAPDPVVVGVAVVTPRGATRTLFTPRRWLPSLRNRRREVARARTARRRQPARRGDYLERAAMAREMHRL
jgi:hypothetical protein